MMNDSMADDDAGKRTLELASFCQSTTLMTVEGEQPVDWLRAGDRVMTRDHGFQKIVWTGRTIVPADELNETPELQPIRIAANSIDAQTPTRDLLLSPKHRVLLRSPQIELLFAADEVIAPIKAFENGDDIAQVNPQHSICYFHILFNNHEVVQAEGLWVESFIPDKAALACLPSHEQLQIHGLLGARTNGMKAVRQCLEMWEIQLLAPKTAGPPIPVLSVA